MYYSYTYLRCGGVVNNQIKNDLLLSLRVKKIKIGEYLLQLPARTWLFRALSSSFSSVLAKSTSAKGDKVSNRICRSSFTDVCSCSEIAVILLYCAFVRHVISPFKLKSNWKKAYSGRHCYFLLATTQVYNYLADFLHNAIFVSGKCVRVVFSFGI